MFRRPGTGRSKAAPDTLCQKCLNRGHYSYECTVSAQQRPYKPRPSRTQQLLNPQLKPKLTTEVPEDLLRKKGVADEILAKKEQERGRKSRRHSSRKRTRSYSSDSVSTISTNRSRSRSPPRKRIESSKSPSRGTEIPGKKRGRRSVSTESDRSMNEAERHTRRRLSSFSPDERGRRMSRSRSSHMDISRDGGGSRRPRKHRSRSRSLHRRSLRRTRSIGKESNGMRPVQDRSVFRSPSRSPNRMDTSEDYPTVGDSNAHASPESRGRWPVSTRGRHSPLSKSRSRSPYRRASPSLYRRRNIRSPSPYQNGKGGRRYQLDGRQPSPIRPQPPPAQPTAPRERSLSPYSKRVALTRQMQGGR